MKNMLLATTALISVLAAGVAGAVDTTVGSTDYSAGVSLLLPEQTGFMYSAQVDAQGLGAGTSSISTETSSFNLTGFASSGAVQSGPAVAGSAVYSDFDFARTVATNAASTGVGRVVATGDAVGNVGSVGSASGATTQKAILVDGVQSSDAASDSQASLVGGGRTSLVAGVIGTAGSFVGDTGTSVTDEQTGNAIAGVIAGGGAPGIVIAPSQVLGAGWTIASLDAGDLANLVDGSLAGKGVVGIGGDWTLQDGGINLSVANAGGGTVSLGADTGGFFTGGVATSGSAGNSFASSVN